jgi:Ni/Co efflux regulator RcnB
VAPANPGAATTPPTTNTDRRGSFRDNSGQARDGRFNQDNRIQGNRFPANRFQGNRGQDRGRRDYSALRRNFTATNRFRGGFYRPPPGFYNRRWVYGEILPRTFWAQDYWLGNFYDYDLPPPPPGTVWVRYGNDALLIDDFDGQIIEVVYNVFY